MDKLTENFMTVTPAYGRDYTKAVDVIADFDANKDFLLQDLRYPVRPINKEQFAPGVRVNIRYAKNRKVVMVLVK